MATTIQNIELPKKPRARDTSGNNNHGEIYSGRGLEFDGVTDYLDGGAMRVVSTGAWTVGAWINTSSTGTQYLSSGNTQAVSSNNIAVLSSKLAIYDHGGSPSTWRYANTAINVNTWYRALWVYDGAGEITFYLNGVADGTGSLGLGGDDDLQVRYVGRPASSSVIQLWNGMLADYQVWDTAWTATDVTYDYLNPESLALNASGTALTESNLKVWYPMQDGHRGQQSYILDGANTGLGVELIENNDFSSVDNWNAGIGWEVLGNNKATNDGTGGILRQSNTVPLNTRFKVVFTVADYVTGNIQIKFAPVGQSVAITGNNTYTVYTAGDNDSNDDFQIIATSGFVGSITNISVKAINDKHHATTVFHGDELVTNGEFTNNITDGWTVDATRGSYAHDTGRIKITNNAASSYPNCSQDIATVIGRTYRVRGGVEIGTATTVEIRALRSGDNASQQLSADGNIDFTFVADQTSTKLLCYLWAPTGNTAEYVFFDNISFQEVGVASGWTDADQQLHIPQPALQSYNELAWSGTHGKFVEVASLAAGLGTNNFAISYVINSADLTDNRRYMAFNNGDSDTGRVIHRINDTGTLEIYVQDSDTTAVSYADQSASGAISVNKTYHIVESFDRSANLITTYINGVASGVTVDISTLDGTIHCNGDLEFNYWSETFVGIITEVALWKNTTLSAAEALELYNDGKPLDALTHTKASTLYGYWRNNGLSTWVNLANPGTKDSSTNTLTETILIPEGVDATRDSQGFLMNKKRSTGSLNLTDGYDNPYVDLGSTTTVADDEASSFVMWLKPDDLTNNHIFGLDTGNTFLISNSTTITKQADGQAKYFSTSLVAYEWVHIAVVKKASNDLVTIYKNGTALTDTETLNEPFDYRHLGAKDSTDGFRGSIDGFLIYNSELSATEVLQNYNATKRDHKN